jgi:hypothetical protein
MRGNLDPRQSVHSRVRTEVGPSRANNWVGSGLPGSMHRVKGQEWSRLGGKGTRGHEPNQLECVRAGKDGCAGASCQGSGTATNSRAWKRPKQLGSRGAHRKGDQNAANISHALGGPLT